MNDLAQQLREEKTATQAEQQQLHGMTTAALMRQALSEIRLLAKAEVLHARLELQDELREAKSAGILLGCCLGLSFCGLSVGFVALALALPVTKWVAALIVAGVLLAMAAVCGAVGYRRVPRKPLGKTQQRLKEDLAITREQFA